MSCVAMVIVLKSPGAYKGLSSNWQGAGPIGPGGGGS